MDKSGSRAIQYNAPMIIDRRQFLEGMPALLPSGLLAAPEEGRKTRFYVLEQFFQKSREEATRIMLHVHQNGVGICGVFTYEVAETKVTQVVDLARKHQHPLQCTMEKE